MPESFTGIIKSIGPEELGSTGKAKPRKLKISDDPSRDGLTFKIWGNSPDLSKIALGKTVTVTFNAEEREYQGNPYTDRMISSVELVSDNGEGGAGDWGVPSTSGGWGSPSETGTATQSSAPSSAPHSKPDYWEQRAIMDEQRSLEMEAAWAVKAILDRFPVGQEVKASDLVDKAIDLITIKRQIAHEMGDGR